MAKRVHVIRIFITRADRQNARPENIRQEMLDPRRISVVRDQGRKPVCDPKTAFGFSQQQHAAIGCDATAIKGSAHLFAAKGWK